MRGFGIGDACRRYVANGETKLIGLRQTGAAIERPGRNNRCPVRVGAGLRRGVAGELIGRTRRVQIQARGDIRRGEVAQMRRRVRCFSFRRGVGRSGEGLERGEGFEDVAGDGEMGGIVHPSMNEKVNCPVCGEAGCSNAPSTKSDAFGHARAYQCPRCGRFILSDFLNLSDFLKDGESAGLTPRQRAILSHRLRRQQCAVARHHRLFRATCHGMMILSRPLWNRPTI